MTSKTLRASLVLVAGGTLVLAGCGSSGGDSDAVAQNADAPITVWVDDTRTEPATDYAAAHPELGAEVESVDNTHGNISSQITLATKGGKAVPDVVFLSFPDEIASLVVNPVNYALPMSGNVDDAVLDGFAEGSTTPCTFDGKVYCLPNDLAQTVLYYNKTLFDQFGYTVPTTFDEWLALGEDVAANHPGYSLGAVNGRYGLNAYYGSSGCQLNDSTSPTSVVIDTASDACTRVNDVLGPLMANGTLSPLDPFDAAFTPVVTDDKLLATISPAWMGEYGIKPSSEAEGNWAVAPMPTWAGASTNESGAVGGGVWIVSATSENRAAALEFVEGMTTDLEVQGAASGYPAFKEAATVWLEGAAGDPWYAEDPSAVYTEAAGKISPTLGSVRYQVQLEDSFNSTVISDGGADTAGAMETFGQEAADAAKSSGYDVKSGS